MRSSERLSIRRRLLLAAAGVVAGHGATDALAAQRGGARDTPLQTRGTALVLGGGGCRGYGHIGFLRGLEEHGLRPDLVVGSSVGSLIGALYAGGMSAAALEQLGHRVSVNTLRDWVFPNLGVFGGDPIAAFVRRHVATRTIEALPLRFAAVATDLQSGEALVFERGDLGRAVQASATLPGLIEPVRIGGRYCVDGNLSSPVPVAAARRLGAARVVAVDVTLPPEHADLRDPYDALYQAFSILTRRAALADRATADLAIEPQLPKHDDMKPATLDALVAAGRRAALDALPDLKRLFARTG